MYQHKYKHALQPSGLGKLLPFRPGTKPFVDNDYDDEDLPSPSPLVAAALAGPEALMAHIKAMSPAAVREALVLPNIRGASIIFQIVRYSSTCADTSDDEEDDDDNTSDNDSAGSEEDRPSIAKAAQSLVWLVDTYGSLQVPGVVPSDCVEPFLVAEDTAVGRKAKPLANVGPIPYHPFTFRDLINTPSVGNYHRTPLMQAVQACLDRSDSSTVMVDTLLSLGANPNLCTSPETSVTKGDLAFDEASPLIIAVTFPKPQVVRLLLGAGASANLSANETRRLPHAPYPIFYPPANVQPTNTDWIYAAGPPSDVHFLRPLQIAAAEQDIGEEMCQLLVDAGAEIDPTFPAAAVVFGSSPFAASLHKNNLATMDYLLSEGASLTYSGPWGIPPLHAAAYRGNVTAINTIIDALAATGELSAYINAEANCADPDVKTPKLRTPLLCAVSAFSVKACQALVAAGADVALRCDGRSTLEWAEGESSWRMKACISYLREITQQTEAPQ